MIPVSMSEPESEAPMVVVNSVGDVVLSDTRTIGALADSDRFELVELLRRLGSATVDDLATASGTTRAAVADMLAILADVGLVTSAGETWKALGRGFLLQPPDDPDGAAAARKLATIMLLRTEHIPRRWVQDDAPGLDGPRFEATGLLNARLTMTPAELNDLQEQLERLIEPYLNRDHSDESTGQVRLLAYVLPEAVQPS
jgi:hypothetical protein